MFRLVYKIFLYISIPFSNVFGEQFANFFPVDFSNYDSIKLSVILEEIHRSDILNHVGKLEDGMITFEEHGNLIYSRSPPNAVGDFMNVLFIDMLMFYINEITRFSNIPVNEKSDIVNEITSIKNIFPECKYILNILNYLYNSDVEFERLLSLYYTLCVSVEKWCDFYLKQNTITFNPFIASRDKLLNKKHIVDLLDEAKYKENCNKVFSNYNETERINFFKRFDKLFHTINKLWMKPESLTFSFLFDKKYKDNQDDSFKYLITKEVHVNECYIYKPNEKISLKKMYNTIIRTESDIKVLLRFFKLILNTIDNVFNEFLYHHFYIIYSNMISETHTSEQIYLALQPLMKKCNWREKIQKFESIMRYLNFSYEKKSTRQDLLIMMNNNNWKNDFIKSKTFFLFQKTVSSYQLNLISTNITKEWQLIDTEKQNNNYAFNYDQTNVRLCNNCMRVDDFLGSLKDIAIYYHSMPTYM